MPQASCTRSCSCVFWKSSSDAVGSIELALCCVLFWKCSSYEGKQAQFTAPTKDCFEVPYSCRSSVPVTSKHVPKNGLQGRVQSFLEDPAPAGGIACAGLSCHTPS